MLGYFPHMWPTQIWFMASQSLQGEPMSAEPGVAQRDVAQIQDKKNKE